MNYKIALIFLLTFLFACEQRYTNLEYNSNFENFSNKGFALIYDEQLYKNKIVNNTKICFIPNYSIDTEIVNVFYQLKDLWNPLNLEPGNRLYYMQGQLEIF